MSDPRAIVVSTTTKEEKMAKGIVARTNELMRLTPEEIAQKGAEEFDFFVDHEAVYDCDPYDVEAYHAEAMLAYWD